MKIDKQKNILDIIFERGLASSKAKAKKLIRNGFVKVDGKLLAREDIDKVFDADVKIKVEETNSPLI